MKFALAVALALIAASVAVASGDAVQDPPIDRGSRIQKIVGGSLTTINQYPFAVALLHNQRGQLSWYPQWCGGTVLTQWTLVTAAHCLVTSGVWHQVNWWRARVGSTFASSGGSVHNIQNFIRHASYGNGNDNDVAVMRTSTPFVYSNNVAPASIAGSNYNLADNQVVWALGWGAISSGGPSSEQLRHVQVWTINQAVCRQRYGNSLTDNMLCSGWLDVGGRDQCQGDSGGPLMHNNVLVGICSFGIGCALPNFPGVNVRVSRYTTWITNASNQLQP